MGGVRLFALLLCGSAAQTAQCGSSSSVTLQLEPPELVGHSNQSKTHYWFPTDMAVVFNATHFLLDARLADDCSDYFCNHTSPHKPSDPSHQVSLSTDGGRSFVPLYEVGGSSPWSSGLADTPFLGPCTLPLNRTTRLSLYQGQVMAPWKSRATLFTLDQVSGLRWRLAERSVRYAGADAICGTGHMWNQGVIPAAGGGWLLSAQCDSKATKATSMLIFKSSDGYDWTLVSSLPAEAPPSAPPCESPGENTLVELTGGKGLLLVARCGGGQQLLGWTSPDGIVWRRHKLPSEMRGVMPVAVRMDDGAIVLTTGRGGLAMWLNADGEGNAWALTNIGAEHNRLILRNSRLNGSALQYTELFANFNATRETTAYNTLRKLGPNSGILCYDRLSSSTAIPGAFRSWDGPPGNLDTNDHMFCMRFRVSTPKS
eukprot:COSAG02_NODE_2234_length_9423_cov_7.200343_1_plen_428_part_00